MASVKDRLAQMTAGIFRVETKDKTNFELKPKLEHKRKLMYNYKLVTEESTIYSEKVKRGHTTLEADNAHFKRVKELTEEQNSLIYAVIANSYPNLSPEDLELIMLEYDDELLLELYMCFKWIDRDAHDAAQIKKESLINELKGEVKKKNPPILKEEQK